MKKVLPHISIGHDDHGRLIVSIEDYELFNYIEDYLAEECGIEYESVSHSKNEQGHVSTMYFPQKCEISKLENTLGTLEPDYIEEIYAINN